MDKIEKLSKSLVEIICNCKTIAEEVNRIPQNKEDTVNLSNLIGCKPYADMKISNTGLKDNELIYTIIQYQVDKCVKDLIDQLDLKK